MNKFLTSVILTAIVASSPGLRAANVFSDDFNSENGTVGVLNYTGFANFSVSDGTVDLIGNGFFDFYPGNGLYVDLDGSTGDAGVFTSSSLLLAPGSYVLSFQLGGSQRGSSESVSVDVETGITSGNYVLGSADPLTTYTLPFVVAAPTSINLVFSNTGGDNIGAILDNVSLDTVSTGVPDASSTLGLLSLGVAGLGMIRRKLAARR